METFPDFTHYLEGTQSNSEQLRKDSEKNIRQCKQLDMKKFICTLIAEVCNGDNSQKARHMASIVFKNTLLNVTQDEGCNDVWDMIPEDLSGQIKEALLTLLSNEDQANIKNAGICLAIIAAIEVPRNQWPSFLTMMKDNSTNDNYMWRLAAVQTLGFTCEFLEQIVEANPDVPRLLSLEQIGDILHSSVLNIDKNHIELTKIAIKALQRTIPATKPCFAVAEQRDFIMNGIFQAASLQDDQVQEDAVQTLAEIPAIGYEQIDNYVMTIGQLTHQMMISKHKESQTRHLIRFWSQLCREETKFNQMGTGKNVISKNWESLRDLIQEGLKIIELDGEQKDIEGETVDDDLWTVSRATQVLLNDCSILLGDLVWDSCIEFVMKQLQGATWQEQYVGMSALCSIMEGPNPEKVAQFISECYQSVFQVMDQSDSSRVRLATANVIQQLTIACPKIVFSKIDNCEMFVSSGTTHMKHDCWPVKCALSLAWGQLYEQTSLSMNQQWNGMLNTHFTTICSSLMGEIFLPEAFASGSLETLINALCSVLESCDKQTQNQSLFHFLESVYSRVLTFVQNQDQAYIQSNLNAEQREYLLNQFSYIFQPLLYGVGGHQISDELKSTFVDFAVDQFNQTQKVTSGGVILLHGLIMTVEQRIHDQLHKFIEFLLFAISSEQTDQANARIACGIISDLANTVGQGLVQFQDKIMDRLQAVMADQQLHLDVKLVAIIAIGDLVLACGPAFVNHIPSALKSFELASEMSLNKSEDEEENQVFEKLRIALLDGYISILHGLNDEDEIAANAQNQLPYSAEQTEAFSIQMFHYVEALVKNSNLTFPAEQLKNMFMLYLDLAAVGLRQFQDNQQNGTQQMPQNMSNLTQMILQSELVDQMGAGLGSIPQEPHNEEENIHQRFQITRDLIYSIRQSMQNGGQVQHQQFMTPSMN